MFFSGECRRLPPLDRVARRTLSAVRSLGKLSIVRICIVAIDALRKDQRLLEISVGVALGTVSRSVLALEGKFRLRMVEALVDGLKRNSLPAICAVAGLASLNEAATMWIFVAVRTLTERDSDISRLAVSTAGMTLGALDLSVQAG